MGTLSYIAMDQKPAAADDGHKHGGRSLETIVRDALLACVAMLLCWSVYELHSLSNRVTAIEANRYTPVEAMNLERRLVDIVGSASASAAAQFSTLQAQLGLMAADVANIRGRLEGDKREASK